MKSLLFATATLVAICGSAFPQAQPQPELGQGTNDTWNLDWETVNGRTYFLQNSDNLTEWSYFPIIESGDGLPTGFGFTSTGERFFLRLRFTDQPTSDPNNADFDGDGLGSLFELTHPSGLDPLMWDTDSDGDSDWQELAQGTDAADAGSLGSPITLNVHQGSYVELPWSLQSPDPNLSFDHSVTDNEYAATGFFPSYALNGPEKKWRDIEATGEQLDFSGNSSTVLNRSLGFDLPFYGTDYGSIFISVRGFLTVVDPGVGQGFPINASAVLPSTQSRLGLIAPYMEYVNLGGGGKVFFQSFAATAGEAAHAVVQWQEVEISYDPGTGVIITKYTFQAVLWEDGRIEFNYESLPPVFDDAYFAGFHIGIQNTTGTEGRTFYANGLGSLYFVPFYEPASVTYMKRWADVRPLSLSGSQLDWLFNFDTLGKPLGTYEDANLSLAISPDGEQVYGQSVNLNIIAGATIGDDVLTGTIGNDFLLRGYDGNDQISGLEGDDELDGGPDNDELNGGPGDDLLIGGTGNDELIGEEGDDTLLGGSGNDLLDGGEGDDTMDAGSGEDKYILRLVDGDDDISENLFSDQDELEFVDVFWENLTIAYPSTTTVTLDLPGGRLATITRSESWMLYPILRFSDGLQAIWSTSLNVYVLQVNRDQTSYPDTNNNGLADWRERLIFGSLQSNLDTSDTNPPSGNQIPDWWEQHYFNGLVDASLDSDGDGLTNYEEWIIGTDPTLFDTDGDGLSDKYENDSVHVDPLIADAQFDDADDDGLLVHQEVVYGTSDNNPDFDGDGSLDGAEVASGASPAHASSKPFNAYGLSGPPIVDSACLPMGELALNYIPNSNGYFAKGVIVTNTTLLTRGVEFSRADSTQVDALFTPRGVDEPLFFEMPFDARHAYKYRFPVAPLNPGAVSDAPYTSNIPTPSEQLGSTAEISRYSNSQPWLTVGDLEFDPDGANYIIPLAANSWANSYGGEDAVGPRNRKIALNGRPLPDSQPQQEGETDSNREQTYIDAFTLGLHHDTSFVYLPLGASDLAIEASASSRETIWNNRSGLSPAESLTSPFGVGWSSNLCSYIEVIETRGQRTNAPLEVNVIDENGRSQRFGMNEEGDYFPWPSSTVDKKTYLNILEKSGNDLVLRKKYGNTLVYKPCDAWFTYSSDRLEGSSKVKKHIYWRLDEVTDRYGVTVKYDYGGSAVSLIPTSITCPGRGQGIAIDVSNNCRRIDSITDARGKTYHFDYTTSTLAIPSTAITYDVTTLDKVRYPDGTDVEYTYSTVADLEDIDNEATYYFHSALGTVQDKRGNTHTFNYAFDRTRKYYFEADSHIGIAASLDGVPSVYRSSIHNQVDQINFASSPTASFRVQHGVARTVSSVQLPGIATASQFTKTANTELVFGPEFTAVSGTEVTDVDGNQTTYDFTDVQGSIVNRSTTYSDGGGTAYSNDWLIYYTTMVISYGNLGSETFEYDPEAGMALTRMVDFSGNETTWEYTDSLTGVPITPFKEDTSLLAKWADPTSKTDALGRKESYEYSSYYRIMNKITDVHGTVTSHSIDSRGRSTAMTVNDKNNVLLRGDYYYYSITLRGFMTKKIVNAHTNVSGRAWESDLVTDFVPNTTSGMVEDVIVDPGGLALTTSYTYDNNNNKLTSTDARQNVTSFTYDDLNRLSRVDFPVAGTSSGQAAAFKRFFYDYNGNVAAEVDEEGNYTFYHRDELNRITDTIRDMDGAELPVHNTEGLVSYIGRGGKGTSDLVTSVTYNDVNSPLTTTDPRDVVTRMEYDDIQRLTDSYTDYTGAGTLAGSSTKTHTEYTYEESVVVDGVYYSTSPGSSGANPAGFKPTKVIHHDAVSTESGTESFTTLNVYDEVYRQTLSDVEFSKTGASYIANHQVSTIDFGAIIGGRESLETVTTDSKGKATKSIADGLGRVTSVIDNFGGSPSTTISTIYSSTGLAWKTIDPLNRESETEYDGAGRPIFAWSPDPVSGVVNRTLSGDGLTGSPSTQTQYDGNGNVVKITNPLGKIWDYSYDDRNRKIHEYQPAIVDATNPSAPQSGVRPHVQISYDGVGNVLATMDARQAVSRMFYDRAYRLTDALSNPATGNPSTDPNNLLTNDIRVRTAYDKNGNVLSVTDGKGNITRNAYDNLNRLLATATDPADGNPVDPSAGGFNASTYQGNGANSDIVVTNFYDDLGNLVKVTDGNGRQTSFTFDGLGRNTRKIRDPVTGVTKTEQSVYDALLQTESINPKGEKTTYQYDDLHRMTGVSFIGRGVDNQTRGYDLLGNLTSVTYPNETANNKTIRGVTTAYDKLNRAKTETSNGVTHTSVYDRASNLRSLTYGETNRVITSTYDARNLLESCSEAIGAATPRVTDYLYNLNGMVTRKTLPNGSYSDHVYDALNRTTAITNSLTNATVIQQSITDYDKANNVTQLVEYTSNATPDQTTTMVYDHVYRLDSETRTEGSTNTITDHGYDKGNNRTSKSIAINGGTAQVTNYQYGTTNDGYNSNQLKSYNRPGSQSVSLSYDANGNRESKTIGTNTDTFSYDYQNRLVSLDLQTATTGNGLYVYQYDHRTRRVFRDESSAGGDSTRVVFSGGLSVQETDEVTGSYDLSAPSVEYVRGSDYGGGVGGVLYTLRDGDSSFNYYNHRGDVILKTDDTGLITWNARYEAFGTRTFEVGSNDDRQKANSKDEDPTGLLNEGFRYRDLETGVFITRDPLGFVDGPNVYTYVRQNPWTKFDPLGLEEKKKFVDKVWDFGAEAAEVVGDEAAHISKDFKNSMKDLWEDPLVELEDLTTQLMDYPGAGVVSSARVVAAKTVEKAPVLLNEAKVAGTYFKSLVGKVSGVQKGAFEIAQEGGKHSGFLKNYLGKSPKELQKGIKSLTKEIAEHQAKIKDPSKYIKDFNKLDPRQQKALVEAKWPSDILRQQEQMDILKGLLGGGS